MSKRDEKRDEILARARERRSQIAHGEVSEDTLRRQDQVRRVKSLLREFILDHGISVRESGRVLGYESVGRLPRHLSQGMIDLEDLLALTEYFEDFDITTILRDVLTGADQHPDEARARREGTIAPDGERIAIEAPKEETTPAAASAPSAPSPQEEGDVEEIVVIQPDAVVPPPEEDEPSLDTDEGLQAWANRFGFAM